MNPSASKLFATALTAAALLGCASDPSAALRQDTLARQIADDAVAFNEAYASAVSSQVLLNILRARDRLPRTYLAMTGIQDAPSLTWGQNAGIGNVNLGEGASPWGVLSLGVRRETTSRPTYAVQPMSADVLARSVFQPTPTNIFEHYWNSGWPRDLLLLLMVEKLSAKGGVEGDITFTNEANDIPDDCRDENASEGCAFVARVRAVLEKIAVMESLGRGRADAPQSKGVCGLIDAYEPSTPVHAISPPQGQFCEPRLVVGDTTYTLSLRSFDDAVYYVGELMRPALTRHGANTTQDALITVRAAGLRGGGEGVPLFRIVPEGQTRGRSFAASVSYNGQRFFAGGAVGRSCAYAAQAGPCRDSAEDGDRSSSVLSLLIELLALNQSPDMIRAPSRLLAE